ncbi:MAG: 2-phospho-L-lactate guanylyltransferase [Nocardioides sp.]
MSSLAGDRIATPSPGFVALVPIKAGSPAKSRLQPLDAATRWRLARAFAVDTCAALAAAPEVCAVVLLTDDDELAEAAADHGWRVLREPARLALNESLRAAVGLLDWRSGATPAAVLADLPALRTDEVSQALLAMPTDAAGFVADSSGQGTTLYAAPAAHFTPAFGADSATLHRSQGAIAVRGELAGLRLDVDTWADLKAAAALGVGPQTARAIAGLGLD